MLFNICAVMRSGAVEQFKRLFKLTHQLCSMTFSELPITLCPSSCLCSMTPSELSITLWSLAHSGYGRNVQLITELCQRLAQEIPKCVHQLSLQDFQSMSSCGVLV